MSKKVILIRGLPGSGKSKLLEELGKRGYEILDEPGLTYDASSIGGALASLSAWDKVAIADAQFCLPAFYRVAVGMVRENLPEHELAVVSFTNDPQQCLQNVSRRMESGDFRKVTDFITTNSLVYSPDGNIIDVWRPKD